MAITITLPDEIYERYQQLAAKTGTDVEELLEFSFLLSPVLSEFDDRPMETLSDYEVLTLADSKMDTRLNNRFKILQDKQQLGELNESERLELYALLEIYKKGEFRKAQGLVEAIQRGLRKRLDE